MIVFKNTPRPFRLLLACLFFTTGQYSLLANETPSLVDDFSHPQNNSLGCPRQFLTDATVGGSTHSSQVVNEGIIKIEGDIVPPRGQPGWSSAVLLLDPTGQPVDASAYQGLRIKIRVKRGNLSLSANSVKVTNFDYHAALIKRQPGEEFQEIKIPFSQMKRTWSEQTDLDASTLNSISIVAFAMQKDSFSFEIDEVSFY